MPLDTQCIISFSEPEPQIIDYVTQQHKVFPYISTVFAFKFSASWLWDMYNSVTGELDAGDLDRLPELHAISCVLKAISTTDASLGIEICRLACGGHGYMTSSRFPQTYGLATAAMTYEGENTVLLLQTARYLMKTWPRVIEGKSLTPTVSYLQTAKQRKGGIFFVTTVTGIIDALKLVAAEYV